MDGAIMEAFLNAVKVSLDHKNDLPIETGKFWIDHMIPCKGPDTDTLDLKLSNYKKMGKFMAYLQKEDLIQYSEVTKKDPVAQMTKVELGDELISDW